MGYVLELGKIDRTDGASAGGKGANLGELIRIAHLRVPDGFCIGTDAYRDATARIPEFADLVDRLSEQAPDDDGSLRSLSAQIRNLLEQTPLPEDIADEVLRARTKLGDHPYAVRSSATAEDLPSLSFAGQHDSYLHIEGESALLHHVSRCWASLFSDRAVAYRQRNGIAHDAVRMAVIVQSMVPAQVAGVVFTADPVTSDRTVVSIDAVAGLGDALVSGLVAAETYKVRRGEVIETAASNEPLLSDERIVELARLGRDVEAHFGAPQDIEWCLTDDGFHLVQTRPITTLFPVPDSGDDRNRVYVSVGHQQMMTDAMKPLGISLWQMTSPAAMRDAGGRLFVDVTDALEGPATRAQILDGLGKSDPLIGDALRTVVARGFIETRSGDAPDSPPPSGAPSMLDADSVLVDELIEFSEAANASAGREIRARSGAELLDFLADDVLELRRLMFHPRSLPAIMTSVETAEWLNVHLEQWLGEKNAADVLAQSVPHNVTSEMGLALLDVADAMRPYPEVVAFLRKVDEHDDHFLDRLGALAGGRHARSALESYLADYGMRCVGEIDVTRPRWSERPATLAPAIVGNIDNFEPGEARRRFEQGLHDAHAKEQELLDRLRTLPDGDAKVRETKRMIDHLRAFAGYREYPKYAMVSRYFEYKKALLREARHLVALGVLQDEEDIYYLRFDELRDMVRDRRNRDDLIRRRKDEFAVHERLAAPRVLTSDGEAVSGHYRRDDLPSGALPGIAVSTGVVEGRARVVVDISQADLEAGDILVTRFTDPSWTPLFVTVAGLVTEVGGLMTHGAVIAREYGLPAVVGVENATALIRDGQWIRVNGTDGHVEILR